MIDKSWVYRWFRYNTACVREEGLCRHEKQRIGSRPGIQWRLRHFAKYNRQSSLMSAATQCYTLSSKRLNDRCNTVHDTTVKQFNVSCNTLQNTIIIAASSKRYSNLKDFGREIGLCTSSDHLPNKPYIKLATGLSVKVHEPKIRLS